MQFDQSPVPQAGAIPIKEGRVCLITSSSGKRWVIPKGMIEDHQTPQECALQEVWEEAGLEGEIISDVVGTYQYDKWGYTFEVSLYLMKVSKILEQWPEQELRQREWFEPGEVMHRMKDDPLGIALRTILADYGFS